MFFPFMVEADFEPQQRFAWSVYALLAVILGVFAGVTFFLSPTDVESLFFRFGVCRWEYHWWAALTCTLLHGGWLHVGANCYFLWLYGRSVERMLGWWRFLGIYLVGAFVSVNLHLLTLSPLEADDPLIGASGAVSAVLGAFLVLLPTAKLSCLVFNPLSFRPLVVEVYAFIILSFWFVGQLIDSLGWTMPGGNVAFWAHVAGFVAGAGLGTLLRHRHQRAAAEDEQQARAPFALAWQAVTDRQLPQAATALAELGDAQLPDVRGAQALLEGVVALDARGEREAGLDALLRAFHQARDYGDQPKLLTCYVQLVKHFIFTEIPADVHRDAGLAAFSTKQTELALWAIDKVVRAGDDERLEQLLKALAGACRHRLERPDLADQVEALLR